MTYSEAIEALKPITEHDVYEDHFKDACKLAIKAMELQVAKKIEIKLVEEDRAAYCPICGNLLSTYYRLRTCNYCAICGNKLDWSVE